MRRNTLRTVNTAPLFADYLLRLWSLLPVAMPHFVLRSIASTTTLFASLTYVAGNNRGIFACHTPSDARRRRAALFLLVSCYSAATFVCFRITFDFLFIISDL